MEQLKKEIDRLKKNPLGDLKEGENLLEAINDLNNNIRKLIDIFTKASADLDGAYSDVSPVDDIRTMRDQNEQIAQGILTVADMLKDMKQNQNNQNASHEEDTGPQPIRPGPKIGGLRTYSPFEQGQGMPAPTPSPRSSEFPDFPDEFSGQIPPPPQSYAGFDNQPPAPANPDPNTNPPLPDRRRGLFRR